MSSPPLYYLRTRQRGNKLGPSPWSPTTVVTGPPSATTIITESQKITPADSAYNSYFGWCDAIDAAGDTIIVGAYADDTPAVDSGSAYIFDRSATGGFTQTAKLLASDRATGDYFGRSVDISRDGNTAIVGAYQDDDNGSNSGSAYIFAKVNGVWKQQQKLTAYDGATDDFFGYTVAISGDGKTVIVGSQQDDDRGSACGSAYAYGLVGSVWVLQAKFVPSELIGGEMFSMSIDLTPDGNLVLVGAHRASQTYLNEGAVFAFKRTNGVWAKTAVIRPKTPSTNANFGQCLKVSNDGLTAIIGAYRDNSGRGAVYIYTYVNGSWVFKQKLTSSDGTVSDNFGDSVSCNADGSTIVIGSYMAMGAYAAAGVVYIFKKNGDTWVETTKLKASDGQKNDNFGRGVAMNEAGTVAVFTATGLATVTASCYVFS